MSNAGHHSGHFPTTDLFTQRRQGVPLAIGTQSFLGVLIYFASLRDDLRPKNKLASNN